MGIYSIYLQHTGIHKRTSEKIKTNILRMLYVCTAGSTSQAGPAWLLQKSFTWKHRRRERERDSRALYKIHYIFFLVRFVCLINIRCTVSLNFSFSTVRKKRRNSFENWFELKIIRNWTDRRYILILKWNESEVKTFSKTEQLKLAIN